VRNAGLDSAAASPATVRSLELPRHPKTSLPISNSLASCAALHCPAVHYRSVLSYTLVFSLTLLWLLSRSKTHSNPQLHPTQRLTTPPPLSRPSHLDTSVSAARALRRGDPLAPDYSTDTHYRRRRIHLPTPIHSPSPQSPVTALPARRRVAHTLQRL
jgi:hypothetical protein